MGREFGLARVRAAIGPRSMAAPVGASVALDVRRRTTPALGMSVPGARLMGQYLSERLSQQFVVRTCQKRNKKFNASLQ